MPTYLFHNEDTGEFFEDFISNSRRETLLEKNPHIKQVPAPFAITSMTGNMHSKVPDGFKDVLSKVAEAHPESTVGQRYGRKSIKEIKSREVIKRHVNKWKNT